MHSNARSPNAPGALDEFWVSTTQTRLNDRVQTWTYAAQADGKVITLPGGDLKAVIGAERREEYVAFPGNVLGGQVWPGMPQRNVDSFFAGNAHPGLFAQAKAAAPAPIGLHRRATHRELLRLRPVHDAPLRCGLRPSRPCWCAVLTAKGSWPRRSTARISRRPPLPSRLPPSRLSFRAQVRPIAGQCSHHWTIGPTERRQSQPQAPALEERHLRRGP